MDFTNMEGHMLVIELVVADSPSPQLPPFFKIVYIHRPSYKMVCVWAWTTLKIWPKAHHSYSYVLVLILQNTPRLMHASSSRFLGLSFFGLWMHRTFWASSLLWPTLSSLVWNTSDPCIACVGILWWQFPSYQASWRETWHHVSFMKHL